jgi:hypothetical protein
MRKIILAVAICLVVPLTHAGAQQSSGQQKEKMKSSDATRPTRDAHSKMNTRGEKGMGFSQTATTHHFLLKPDGGIVQVESNNPADTDNRDNIRMHLMHISKAFSSGDFDIPMFVHDTVPPGIPEMKRLRKKISYSFEETPNGGQVVLSTSDGMALAAIHKFLSFQIQEHKTGDQTMIR